MAFRPTRREFVKVGAMAGAGLLLAGRRAYGAFAQTPSGLKLFVQELRGLGDMAPATKVAARSYAAGDGFPGVDYYEIAAREYLDTLHPDLAPTKLWGYADLAKNGSQHRHLGGAIIANKGTAVRIRLHNQLPNAHILPVDGTVPGVDATTMAMRNRVAVHLHGGKVPWTSDGGPHHWFGPGNTGSALPENTGLSYKLWLPDPDGGALTADYWYPNVAETARLMWYHDHAVGITRLNAYAGLATAYIVRDPDETYLIDVAKLIPSREIPLVFQDKVFDPDAAKAGQLWYPSVYDTQFFALTPFPGQIAPPVPSLVPEFWGDTILVNGTVSPYVRVYPRKYRFRILNACNTRFLSMKLVYAAGLPGTAASCDPNPKKPGPVLTLIGNECGFLDPAMNGRGVVYLNGAADVPLTLAPAERADVIIDFSLVPPGSYLILSNNAPVPFPGGTPLADFYPGNRALAFPPAPGEAPNTRSLLQFRVEAAPLGEPADPKPSKAKLPPLNPPPFVPWGTTVPPAGAPVRDLTLNEVIDEYGRLAQELGCTTAKLDPAGITNFGLPYTADATETPTAGSVEVWRIFNLTADAHPIHFHLANVQVLSRQPFNVKAFNGVPSWTGGPRPADPDEMGWKETVRMYPGECTTVIMKFDLPPDPVIPVTTTDGTNTIVTPTQASPGVSTRTGGCEYVWHCHILEHEEHDMMRPLVVNIP